MKLYIKGMTTYQCKIIVINFIESFGLHKINDSFKIIEIAEKITGELYETIRIGLKDLKFELMDIQTAKLIDSVFDLVFLSIQNADVIPLKSNFYTSISEDLGHDPEAKLIPHLLSKVTGESLKPLIIKTKIAQVKKWLKYDNFTLAQIYVMLDYCSVQHLSNQFLLVEKISIDDYLRLIGKI